MLHPLVQQILMYQKQERLAHAYLLIGEDKDHLYDVAFQMAQALNCQKTAYQQNCDCVSCYKIATSNHPDFFMIEKPEDRAGILIAQITTRENASYRPLLPWLSVKPLESRVRIVLIKDVDLMTEEAANAFLKTLEEPPPQTVFLLTTTVVSKILPTIKSRCQHLLCGQTKKVLGQNPWIASFVLARLDDKAIKTMTADKQSVQDLLETVLMFYRDLLMCQMGAGMESLCLQQYGAEIQSYSSQYQSDDVLMILEQATKAMQIFKEGLNVRISLMLLKEMMDDKRQRSYQH